MQSEYSPGSEFSQDHRTCLGSDSLVDSGSCARASRGLQMHRGYWHYPWYFDSKLPYNYTHIVILGISLERILGSGLCKTSCTMLKKVIFLLGRPLKNKNSERSAKGHVNLGCTKLEFWSKTHLGGHRSSAQTQLANFAVSYRTYLRICQQSSIVRYSCTLHGPINSDF